jgi:outer membrane protein TolC
MRAAVDRVACRGAAVAIAAALLAGRVAPAAAQDAHPPRDSITLPQAIEIAQRQGLQAAAASATRDAARQRDRAFGARYLPQMSLNGTLPAYNKSFTGVIQPDGSTIYHPVQTTDASVGLVVSQKLPLTGGDLFIASSLDRYDQTTPTNSTLRTWTSTPLSVGIRQDIFRPNAAAWDAREQDVNIEFAERQYFEAKEDVALLVTSAFFDLYSARTSLANAVANAAVNDTLYTLNKGRFEVGKIGENDLLQSELSLLRARSALDGAKLEYERAAASFRLALNAGPGTPLDITVTPNVPDVEPDTAIAVKQALKNRSLSSALELSAVQADRRITEAKLNNGAGATVQATYGYNATSANPGAGPSDVYRDLLDQQKLSLSVSIPLWQWGLRSGLVAAAQADQRRTESTSRVAREQSAQDARFAALTLSQARRQLALAAKSDTVAAKRFEVAYARYVIGKIGVDNLYIAQNEKDQALQQFVQALRGYWTAYYQLRKITLYDFAEGRAIR